ncbi:MAG: hypothetical protein AB1649_32570 [Chloroflexota bacterium]
MNKTGSRSALGCLAWLAACVLLTICCAPVAMIGGSISSTAGGDFVARTLTPILCPDGSHGEIVTFATTSHDEFGNEHPATGYEMQCVDASGVITRGPSPDYAFVWMLVLMGSGLIFSAVAAFLLVAPASVLLRRLFGKAKQSDTVTF